MFGVSVLGRWFWIQMLNNMKINLRAPIDKGQLMN